MTTFRFDYFPGAVRSGGPLPVHTIDMKWQGVRTPKPLTIDTLNLDDEREMDEFDRQVIFAGMDRVRTEIADMQRKGLLDAEGKLTLTSLPRDMQEGAERDFGG